MVGCRRAQEPKSEVVEQQAASAPARSRSGEVCSRAQQMGVFQQSVRGIMTIKAKLAINVITLVFSFLVIMLIHIVMTDRIDESTRKGLVANRIVIGVSDMNTITYDYVMNT